MPTTPVHAPDPQPLCTNVVDCITKEVARNFQCFGGGRGSSWNPIAQALKDEPPSFVAGTPVESVVRLVLKELANHV